MGGGGGRGALLECRFRTISNHYMEGSVSNHPDFYHKTSSGLLTAMEAIHIAKNIVKNSQKQDDAITLEQNEK